MALSSFIPHPCLKLVKDTGERSMPLLSSREPQLSPPFLVIKVILVTVPLLYLLPLDHPSWAFRNLISFKSMGVPLLSGFHETPPSSVFKIEPSSPQIQPTSLLRKNTSFILACGSSLVNLRSSSLP